MLNNILLALVFSVSLTGLLVYIIRPAWQAWDETS